MISPMPKGTNEKKSVAAADMKDLFTSKDWVGQYRSSHVDIDYKNQSFSSSSDTGNSADATLGNGAVQPSPAAPPISERAVGIPRSADINFLLSKPNRSSSAASNRSGAVLPPADSKASLKSAGPGSGVDAGFGTLPPSEQFTPPATDFMGEYNAMFGGGASPVASGVGLSGSSSTATEELAKQANISLPIGLSSSIPPSFDLNALLKTSLEAAPIGPDGKRSLPPSLDILKHLVSQHSTDSLLPSTTSEQAAPDGEKVAAAIEAAAAAAALNAVKTNTTQNQTMGPKKARKNKRNRDPTVKEYVEPTDKDVLLGRGGRSNHHPGNKRYRDEVHNLQKWYKASAKPEKTDLSQCLVNYIHSYGGRFLKLDSSNQQWFIVTNIVARRKASQALREHMTLEERAAMKASKTQQSDEK